MAYRYQLRDARDSDALKSISGVCTNGPEFVSILNEAMERLLIRGNWFGTEFLTRFCLFNGCLTLPRYVSTLMGIRFCGCHHWEIKNHWYEILRPYGDHRFDCSHTLTETGTSATYSPITGTAGKFIRVYPTKLEDVGKLITLFGVDSGGQPLQEKVGGVWRRGITLTMAAPFVQSPMLISKIISVTRDMTQANVIMYEYDAMTNTQRDIALYEPTENRPQYRQYFIPNFCAIPSGCSESDNVILKTAEALVKLEFIKVVNDEDFLAIDSFTALKFMIQAIRLEGADQDDKATTKILKAVDEMNMQERNKLPGIQTVVMSNPVGRDILNPI